MVPRSHFIRDNKLLQVLEDFNCEPLVYPNQMKFTAAWLTGLHAIIGSSNPVITGICDTV